MVLEEFINENFITPLCKYYTLPGTITYGIILVLAVLGTYKLLRYLKIDIDKKFLIGILPFIIYGGWTRALRDHMLGIYQNNLFCSPPIYFFIFIIALASLLLGLLIQKITKDKKKFSYEKPMLIIGILFLLYNLSLTKIANIFGFSFVLLLVSFWGLVFLGINHLKPKLLSIENAGILTAHLLDASSTFTALTFFGYYEQHVLPTFLINIFGPWIMFPLKIIVVWFVLLMIDRSKEDIFFKRFLKIIILILGLALGIRDFLTLSIL
jgi:uncharacterized membrane protein